MLVLRRFTTAICLSFILVAVFVSGSTTIAFADSTTGPATVNAGTLTETNATTPAPSITLNGSDQTASYTLTITVIDAAKHGDISNHPTDRQSSPHTGQIL